ncbi:hypothetical protein [Wolbachia endosymbiont of Frankliniella intonsa]|uniref:hypothetical protein n=1 Tax=Wolbachia endosymbiont of Frankliniella intonsa TaxID=2902422 RepID=UPI00244ECC9F|nr:hypothetical protein [Wolbachia endosymbiont of Frankliniella intonsa]WGJ62342.1 hypothetical protein M3L71_01320 [Wolbachia endosymbiont of Frankliniella intonsa]
MPKGKPNTFIESIHDAHNHDIRKMYCIAVGLTGILCKISLQFCCEFIDNNRSNICTILDISKFIKLPTSIIFALHFGLNLAGYKSKKLQNGKGGNEPEKPIQVVGSSAFLANCVIGILMQTKIIHFLAGNNKDIISYISLTSAVLFLFSEFVSCYYKCEEYKEVHKKYQEACKKYKKGDDELTKCEAELAKCKKNVMFSTFTFSLGLLSFTLKRMEIATIPIDLGGGIIYNLNLTVTVSLILSIAYLVSNIDKFVNQPNNGTDPSTGFDDAHHIQHNGSIVESNYSR